MTGEPSAQRGPDAPRSFIDAPYASARPRVAMGGQRSPGRDLMIALFMTAAYFLSARYGLELLANPNGVAVFWPASGVAVSILLLFGRGSFLPIAAGIALATIAANVAGGRPFVLAPPFALANVLEALVFGWVAERFFGSRLRFDALKRVLGLFLAGIAGTAVGGAVGALALGTLGNSDGSLLTSWHEWVRSDFIGIIAITPLVLGLWALMTVRALPRDHVEGLLLLVLVSATAVAIYPGLPPHTLLGLYPPEALLFPPLLLLAIRQPLTYSPIGASAVALIIVASTMAEGGIATYSDIMRSQMAIVSMVACSLSLGALIAERRAGEQHQRLLIAELNHRVKNGLALVQAIVDRSRESAYSIDEFYSALGGRIRSMARTHSMLSREMWHGLSLAELIATELSPYQRLGADTLSGPSIMLGPILSQSFSLVLHELATNAVKHGALSCPEGQVVVTWAVEPTLGDDSYLVIKWCETGSPPQELIGPPSFGTSIIRDLLSYEAEAIIELRFLEDGARCTIRIPMSNADITLV